MDKKNIFKQRTNDNKEKSILVTYYIKKKMKMKRNNNKGKIIQK